MATPRGVVTHRLRTADLKLINPTNATVNHLFSFLDSRSIEDLFHAAALRRVELEVHASVRDPRALVVGRVLVHKVGVLGPTRSTKVLNLPPRQN